MTSELGDTEGQVPQLEQQSTAKGEGARGGLASPGQQSGGDGGESYGESGEGPGPGGLVYHVRTGTWFSS